MLLVCSLPVVDMYYFVAKIDVQCVMMSQFVCFSRQPYCYVPKSLIPESFPVTYLAINLGL